VKLINYDNTPDFTVGSFPGFKYMLSKNIDLFLKLAVMRLDMVLLG
jgi:hypothetical protein